MGEHLYTYIDPPNERHLLRICEVLSQGKVIALPMQTSWAFCCDATSRRGLMSMYALKPEHPKNRPFSLVCSDISMASSMANIGGQNYQILKRLLPGAYTILLKSSRLLPKRLKDKREKVGIRIPKENITQEILKAFGKPLAATSVPTPPSEEAMQMGYQIHDHFGHALAMVIDIGLELPASESTILDCTGEEIVLIRLGAGEVDSLGL